MKKIILSFILIFTFPSNALALDSYGIYEILNKSIVRINIWQDYGSDNAYTITGGSGVVINEQNGVYFILTNAHVLLEEFCLFDEYGCVDKIWEEDITIAIDTPDTEFDYPINNNEFMYWSNYDFAVIRVDMNNYITEDQYHDFTPIAMGGNWHPLMRVYGAGFPSILGNYDKDYAELVFCSGVVNTMFMDEDSLYQLGNYSIVHSCALAGGMSGGPLVDDKGLLLGINGLSGGSELYSDEEGNLVDIDIAAARFDYAMDIWELYRLEILSLDNEEGHFNRESIFYEYLPKLSFDYHSEFYNDYTQAYPEKIDKIKLLFE